MLCGSMDQQEIMDILSGRRRGAGAAAVRAVLSLAAAPYATLMRCRRWAYRRGILPARRAVAPVICVGNITTGGTGKTPMVEWVVRRLRGAGRTPAVLTRGYRSRAGLSDEAELLKLRCDAAVVADADRVAAARSAVAGGADVLVMDDGFQHRRLRRELDIVLIDATCPFGFGRTLPRGLLREPPSALRDAGAVVVTRSDAIAEDQLQALRECLSRLAPEAGIHLAVHEPVEVLDETGRSRPLSALSGRKVFAFCGIGNPAHFFASLEGLGARLVARRALDDHVAYTPEVTESISLLADRSGAGLCVTTQKDFVKIAGAGFPLPVWRLVVRMKIVEGEAELVRQILAATSRSE